MGNIQTVGPNEAVIVSGGCCRSSRRQIIVGGWCWSTWMLTNIQRISLEIMTVNPKCDHVQSNQGVPVTVTVVCHCKIMSTSDNLARAAEQFLGKSIDHIKSVVLHTVEGHMRAVIGTQKIEDICSKRQELASMIREASSGDLSRMGIDIMGLTVKDIKDDVEYLSSAGKKSTAKVKQQAAITTAIAEGKAADHEATLDMQKHQLMASNESRLAELRHEMEEQEASSNEEIGSAQAEATKAYDLQLATLQKGIREIEMDVKKMECEGMIEIQKKENERRTAELEIEIELPTKAEIHELMKQTEAFQARMKCEAEAEEYKIKEEGRAKAEASKIEGNAIANGMKEIAKARKEFNQAAVLFEILKVLPEVAAEIAHPLTKFEEIVLISDGAKQEKNYGEQNKGQTKHITSFTPEAAKLTSAVPMAIKAVGGSDKMSGNIVNTILQMQKLAN